MIVSIKSQCGKKALIETRRILDQFFERAGDRCWEGAITLDGLIMVRKLLRKTARRNTAVVCHRIRGTRQLELEWIVGNARLFNAQGKIPTNRTGRDVLKSDSENQWHTAEAIALMAGIAGLFHDFGKANALFQKKLKGQRGMQEPLRHEWLSLLMFVAFVNGRADREWLQALREVQPVDDQLCQAVLVTFRDNKDAAIENPFSKLPPLAQTIGWLIVSHHRLPIYPVRESKQVGETEAEYSSVDPVELEKMTLVSENWHASWNSPQWKKPDWQDSDWQQLFDMPHGTPIQSQSWCRKARQLAQRALRHTQLCQPHWLNTDLFTCHVSRLALMLADHSYSAGDANDKWWDKSYQVHANTDKKNAQGKRPLKQRLDEHNIGVGQHALLLARQLPRLREQLPVLVAHKGLQQRTKHSDYTWQNKAYELACGLAESSKEQGFFGVNMASTGKGKTFANARIMYGLAREQAGCRFSIALGLRTLTLQTGDALRDRLNLDSDDLAVMVGSQAVQELHRRRSETEQTTSEAEKTGSESADELIDGQQYLSYDGTLSDGPLRRWLSDRGGRQAKGTSDKALKLLSAPVLVTTIDHLMPATEGVRGGKQIAPMLRFLTSDLVLDEPDDFDSADLPALCRLVNWAGLLGSRVLLSSASLPPVMLTALFSAYLAGRRQFEQAVGTLERSTLVPCAWFDEFGTQTHSCDSGAVFKQASADFVTRRVSKLKPGLEMGKALRKAAVLPVAPESQGQRDVISALVKSLWQGMQSLHDDHCDTDPGTGKRVSVGLIRMANINPLVAVARQLIEGDVPSNVRLHLCVYHSQHPLLVRAHIEERLDHTLNRKQPEDLWQQPEIRAALDAHPEQNHLFVVLGSPVTEVGRDHDYDWAIAEPSSMRSLIQLAGRIQRHRKQPPEIINMLVFNQNVKTLTGTPLGYAQPGFEARAIGRNKPVPLLQLEAGCQSMAMAIAPKDLNAISSIPRIESRPDRQPRKNLVDLEQVHLGAALDSSLPVSIAGRIKADQWWQIQPSPSWHAETQRLSPFRKSTPDDAYVLYQKEDDEALMFCRLDDHQPEPVPVTDQFEGVELVGGDFVSRWIGSDPEHLIGHLARELGQEVSSVSRRFGEIRLRRTLDSGVEVWQYHPWLGVFRSLRE